MDSNVARELFVESLILIGLPLCTRRRDSGLAKAVEVLRKSGIVARLQDRQVSFSDAGDVTIPSIGADSGPPNLTNFNHFLQGTGKIASAVRNLGAQGSVFGLGGDCSICVGTLAGIQSGIGGSIGIVWIDAHGDFNTPKTTPSGFIGGMCLAMACGRGPHLEGIVRNDNPLVTEENVVHLANRALDPAEAKAMSSSPMQVYSASTLREKGIAPIVSSVTSKLADRCGGILCHLDIDAIDPKLMPAVNFPEPHGLTLDEAKTIVAAVQATSKLKLFELAGYNADLDVDGTCAKRLISLVSDMMTGLAFSSRGYRPS